MSDSWEARRLYEIERAGKRLAETEREYMAALRRKLDAKTPYERGVAMQYLALAEDRYSNAYSAFNLITKFTSRDDLAHEGVKRADHVEQAAKLLAMPREYPDGGERYAVA